jgi:preprotein translocase subunit SecG
MELIETLVVVGHVLAAVALVVLVLLQQGKGADMGASFGAGASQTLFGSEGSGSFMTRMTSVIALVFFISSFALAVFAKQHADAVAEQDFIPVVDESLNPGAAEGVGPDGSPSLELGTEGDPDAPDLE